jgi:putative addiction module component (TIGR02574 family)
MTIDKDTLFREATKLSPLDRADLIEALFDSFEPDENPQYDKLWAEEAERRYKAVQNGEMETISEEDVFSEIESGK